MISGKNYIGGRRVTASGKSFTSFNPATGEAIWQGRESTDGEVGKAFEAAGAAFLKWRRLPHRQRIRLLRAYAALVEKNKNRMAEIISAETGKALWDARGEVSAVIRKVEISIRAYDQRTPTIEGSTGALRTRLTHRPHGVMGVIGPYNFPCHLANGHIVPALLAGNTVVFKPSSWTPWSAELMIDFWHQAGIPEGVINLVQGGRTTGQAILGNPGLKGLLFTGGVPIGKLFARQLAERLDVIVALELGGNNPLVVWQAANQKAAVITTIQSAFITSGQRCTCARRLIVPDNQEGNKFIAALVKGMDGITVGMPDGDPQPFMGSLISAEAAGDVLERQSFLEGRGGKVLRRAKRLALGDAFVSPGLVDVTDIKERDDVECFGPILQVIRAGDFEAALDEANNTDFGLAAGILTDNKALYEQFYAGIEAGIVNWNQPLPGASSEAPFGGLKDSGNHRPSAYYAADYVAWPMASLETAEDKLTMPTVAPGLKI